LAVLQEETRHATAARQEAVHTATPPRPRGAATTVTAPVVVEALQVRPQHQRQRRCLRLPLRPLLQQLQQHLRVHALASTVARRDLACWSLGTPRAPAPAAIMVHAASSRAMDTAKVPAVLFHTAARVPGATKASIAGLRAAARTSRLEMQGYQTCAATTTARAMRATAGIEYPRHRLVSPRASPVDTRLVNRPPNLLGFLTNARPEDFMMVLTCPCSP
jgi:hypothetical protein